MERDGKGKGMEMDGKGWKGMERDATLNIKTLSNLNKTRHMATAQRHPENAAHAELR